MSNDQKMRQDVTELTTGSRTNVHIRGFYGDAGENEGVLSVCAEKHMTRNHPEHTAICIGSPARSPLIHGFLPDLGMFSCSVESAERLVEEIKAAIEIVRAGYKP